MGNFFLSKLNLQVLNKVVIIPMDGVALILEAMGHRGVARKMLCFLRTIWPCKRTVKFAFSLAM